MTPRFTVNESGTGCSPVPPPPLGCMDIRDEDGWNIKTCPEGMIRRPNSQTECYKPACGGQHSYALPVTLEYYGY